MRISAQEFAEGVAAFQGLAALGAHVYLMSRGGARPPTPAPPDAAEELETPAGIPDGTAQTGRGGLARH